MNVLQAFLFAFVTFASIAIVYSDEPTSEHDADDDRSIEHPDVTTHNPAIWYNKTEVNETRSANDADIEAALAAHNNLRAKVAIGGHVNQPRASNMQELVWNTGLANSAQDLANSCHFAHDDDDHRRTPEFPGTVGQNVAEMSLTATGHDSAEYSAAIEFWFTEIDNFDPSGVSSFEISSNTGHYTQLVWANTYAVGCGYSICNEMTKIYVCNYGPGGNIIGEPVYEEGSACTKCKNGCSKKYDGLCATEPEDHDLAHKRSNATVTDSAKASQATGGGGGGGNSNPVTGHGGSGGGSKGNDTTL